MAEEGINVPNYLIANWAGKRSVEICNIFKDIRSWLLTSYGQHTSLVFNEKIIPSQRGVQQGDPMGTFLFATALKFVLEKVCSLTITSPSTFTKTRQRDPKLAINFPMNEILKKEKHATQ